MNGEPYELRRAAGGTARLVVERSTGRLLAGVGNDHQRAWVFPVNTPHGIGVTQESAFDHPFHRSIFVGQGLVNAGGREAQFWAFQPDWRAPDNYIFSRIGLLRYEDPVVEQLADGFRFTYETTWCDEELQPMFDEVRVIDVRSVQDATVVDLTTSKRASYADVEFSRTKHGVIGVRVQPQLLPVLGGQVIAVEKGERRSGSAEDVVNGRSCDYVAYEADVPSVGRYGVCLKALANTAADDLTGPWFCRDYGMAMFNPTHLAPVHLRQGEVWTVALRTVAYDGALDHDRAARWFG
ncbi:DUF6807 family protein [Actinopolymorpha alba]|uniref:DUF6807 family protein n=1 Tax=Actinopolymorpha alba TaxID=533267 RepID=UPI00036D0F13|nr:DUF6807 family protein [Actinopolymorpha alba]